ncbi:hypothetical protein DRQ26_01060 [bacterium]|nr:MAG: hypothetical protein DRQ26_01060 [bacterium]
MKAKTWMGVALVLIAFALIPAISFADTSDTVTCSAIFTQLGITVSPATYDFGYGTASQVVNTTDGYFTVNNTGNKAGEITISASGNDNWQLGTTPDNNQAVMKAKGGDLTDWTLINSDATLYSSLDGNNTSGHFDLLFQFPSSTNVYTTQHFTVTLTIAEA